MSRNFRWLEALLFKIFMLIFAKQETGLKSAQVRNEEGSNAIFVGR